MRMLLSRLRSRFGATGEPDSALGFVFVSDADDGPMTKAEVGAIVRNVDHGPPWIVVGHFIESIVVARWPGRLWRVAIIEPASEQPNATAPYTRAVAVRVLEEQPVAQLFGSHGDAVCNVIGKARDLTLEDVLMLGDAVPEARDAYSRTWNLWLAQVEPDSIHRGEDHSDTLAVSGGARSPIGGGFTVLYSVLTARARSLVGDAAFVTDEEGEQSFASDWAAVSDAFLHAALAFGAPELLSSDDRKLLTSAWTKRYGE